MHKMYVMNMRCTVHHVAGLNSWNLQIQCEDHSAWIPRDWWFNFHD